MEYNERINDNMSANAIGTYRYMAPEQLKSKLSLKTDVWAFGCVLLEFCTG